MLPFEPRSGLIIAPVRLSGPGGELIVRLAIDTGATTTTIRRRRLERVGYDVGATSQREVVTTASGTEVVPRLRVLRIESLGVVRKNFFVGSHDVPASADIDGLRGLDFFRGHKLLIDLRIGLVTVD